MVNVTPMLRNIFGRQWFARSTRFVHSLSKRVFVRRATWESNLRKVEQHNLRADLGMHTYWLGMNKFADLVRFDRDALRADSK